MIQRAIGHVKNFQTQESLHKMSTSIQNRANLKAKPTGNVYIKHLYSVSHQQLHGEQSQRTPPALLLFSLFSLLIACCAYIFCNKITNSSVSLDCIEWKKGQNPNSSMFNCHRQKHINMGPCWYYTLSFFPVVKFFLYFSGMSIPLWRLCTNLSKTISTTQLWLRLLLFQQNNKKSRDAGIF